MSIPMQIEIPKILINNIAKQYRDGLKQNVNLLASKFGFDVEEGYRVVQCDDIQINIKDTNKRKRDVISKPKFIVPFEICRISTDRCKGIVFDKGLMTQCMRKVTDTYCAQCQKSANHSENGIPECGNITTRSSVGYYDYVDNKGRQPKSYKSILEKANINIDEYILKLQEHGIHICEEHLNYEEPTTIKSRGRPKKEKTVIATESENANLFEVAQQQSKIQSNITTHENEIEQETEDEPVVKHNKKNSKQPPNKKTKLVHNPVDENENVVQEVEEVTTKKTKTNKSKTAEKTIEPEPEPEPTPVPTPSPAPAAAMETQSEVNDTNSSTKKTPKPKDLKNVMVNGVKYTVNYADNNKTYQKVNGKTVCVGIYNPKTNKIRKPGEEEDEEDSSDSDSDDE